MANNVDAWYDEITNIQARLRMAGVTKTEREESRRRIAELRELIKNAGAESKSYSGKDTKGKEHKEYKKKSPDGKWWLDRNGKRLGPVKPGE